MTSERTYEDELVRRCQAGEVDAFRPLVERYGPLAYRTVYLMVRNPALAEDIVQEGLLAAWRGIRSFKAGTCFRAWLLRIVVNKAISHRRRKSFMRLLGRDSADDEKALAMVTAPTDDLDLRIAIRQAIGKLDERQRLVVMLRYFAELSVPEIARVLSWREGTVKSRLHRALRELRRKLEPEIAPEVAVELRPQQKEEV